MASLPSPIEVPTPSIEVCCTCQEEKLDIVPMGPYWGTTVMCKECFENTKPDPNGYVECVGCHVNDNCQVKIKMEDAINKGNTWFCFDCSTKF